MDIINLNASQWVWLIIAALLIGFSKTGINGALTPVIAVLASIFGGKESTGLILLMLIIGDIFAVFYYHQHAQWSKIRKVLPFVIIGLILGASVGIYISDQQFKNFIAISVLICLFILIYMDIKKESLRIPNSVWVYTLAGVLTGFTTMIGNAAGPIFSIYLLSMGFKKQEFMGTTAWAFFIINLLKVPFQVFFWHNITPNTLLMNGMLIPVIAIGAILGAILIKKINEKVFHNVILVMTAIAAIRLLI